MQSVLPRSAKAPAALGAARYFLWLSLAVVLLASGGVSAQEFTRSPAPAWVEPVPLPTGYALPTQQLSGGVYYLLVDSQTRLQAQGRTGFRRYVVRTVTAEGVQEAANIEISFDPSYQSLTLHAINLIRNGKIIQKLPTATVRILQREKELERLIYDGSKTASIFLEDVRVGDVVDYSYSVTGSNPVFGNRHFGAVQLRWGSPLELRTARLLVPVGRKLTWRGRNGASVPKPVPRDGYLEYRVHLAKLEALVKEEDAPGWFQPYPVLEYSEFADWNAVARWAAAMYRQPGPLSAPLQAEVARIRAAHLDEGGKLLAVLKFVQGEVRYLGVEIGAGSHAPRMPNEVFERRFGDCKDKALLTIVMLHALGIPAQAALVNTAELRAIRDAAPRPDVFDHVIVRAQLAGKSYWLDPTRNPQSGTLATLFQPNYGVALIADPSSTGLIATHVPASSASVKIVHALLDSSGGMDKPVRYTITTRNKGSSAETMRNTLASSNLQALQKTYLNYYAGFYPSISVAAPMTAHDDAAGNELTTVEHYLVDNFWVNSKTAPERVATLHAPEIEDVLDVSASSIRMAPLAVWFPLDITLTTEVLLPQVWNITAETVKVEGAAFSFERGITAEPKRLVLVDHFRTRMDHVPAAGAAAHADKLRLARESTGYELTLGTGPAAADASGMERFNWPLAMLAAMLLLALGYGALRLYRYDPPPVAKALIDPTLAGFSGWLILLMIGLLVLPFKLLLTAVEAAPAFATDNWSMLTVPGGAHYHPLWAPALLFDLVAILAQGVCIVLLIVLFFNKRRSTPRVYIALVSMSLATLAVGLLVLNHLSKTEVAAEDWKELVQATISAAIWIPYWLVSKRVKATFTRGWGEAKHPAAALETSASTPE